MVWGEVSEVHEWQSKYSIMHFVGIDVLIGNTTFGSFYPSPKNRKFLVANTSYYPRLFDTPDGVMVRHHSWKKPDRANKDHVYMAPP